MELLKLGAAHRGGEAAVPSSRFKVQTFKLE